MKYEAAPGSSDFTSCAGLVYPGSLVGWGPTWNKNGVFFTVNTLLPKKIRFRGVTTSFIQRDAICGGGDDRSLDDVLEGLRSKEWADGASINVVDTATPGIANIETWEAEHSTLHLTDRMGNMSHCNTCVTPFSVCKL